MEQLELEVENTTNVLKMGELLKEARKKANLTQEELAFRIGSKRSHISRIERDASSVKISTLIKIIENGLGGKVDINITI